MKRLSSWLDQADAVAAGRELKDYAAPLDAERLAHINALLEQRVTERTGLLRVLHDVTVIANESKTIDEAFRRVLKRVSKHNGWCYGHVYVVSRHDPNLLVRAKAYYEENPGRFAEFIRAARKARLGRGIGLPGRVAETGDPAWLTDVNKELTDRGIESAGGLNLKSAAAFPVKVDSEVLAVFEFFSDKELLPDQRVLDSMASIGTHLGLFIVRKRMKRRIAELATLEQQRIGRDLHDDLGQQLTGVALLAKSLERDLRKESSPHADRVAEIARGLKEAQTHVRLLARGLVPVEIKAHGLIKALADLAHSSTKRFEIDVRFVPAVETLPRDSETATELYRIAQEAVTNAAKHGKATAITIELATTDDELELTITDNGVGISETTLRRLGVGMSTMVFRASVIGGEFTIEPNPAGGTIVRCTVIDDDEVPDLEYLHGA